MTEGIIADFGELPALKQRAVVLKTQGNTHAAIAKQLQREFKSKTTKKTIDKWLAPTGALWQPYMALNEQLAEAALAEAHQLVQVYASEAVITLRELSRPPHAPKVRVQAAKALASPIVGAVIKDMPPGRGRRYNPEPLTPELQREIDRELEITRLGEEALTKRQAAIEGEAADV